MWNLTKKLLTKPIVLIGGIAILVLILILSIVIGIQNDDRAPHEWFIRRDMWNARWVDYDETMEEFKPLRLVVIHHSVTGTCYTFRRCAREMRRLQRFYHNNLNYDVPFSFMIGNDGRVYEGRGFYLVGAHLFGYNRCTLGIAFIGDYREGLTTFSRVTPLQVENTHRLLDGAVKRGVLHPDYQVVGARDLRGTESPGDNLYNEIRSWPTYDHNGLYREINCTEIQEMFEESSEVL